MLAEIFGYAAAAVGTTILLPQAFKSYKTKSTGDLSLAMAYLFVLNNILWIVYGFLINSVPVWLCNCIAICVSLFLLFMKLKHG